MIALGALTYHFRYRKAIVTKCFDLGSASAPRSKVSKIHLKESRTKRKLLNIVAEFIVPDLSADSLHNASTSKRPPTAECATNSPGGRTVVFTIFSTTRCAGAATAIAARSDAAAADLPTAATRACSSGSRRRWWD